MNPDHPVRAAHTADPRPGAAAAGSGLAALGPTWRLYVEYWRMVRRHVPEHGERLRCYAALIGWVVVNWNAVRLLLEPIGSLDLQPGARASEIRQRMLMGVRGAQLRLRQR